MEGKDITELEPNKRNVNTVFQNYALFPHMNVADNVGYGLKIKKRPKSEIAERVSKMLKLVQLWNMENVARAAFRRSASENRHCKSVGQ